MTRDEQWLLDEKYHGEKTRGFFTDCSRLTAGEPLAYIIGHIPFFNTTIHLTSRPLIPRTETEFWTERVIKEITDQGKTLVRVLDLCAGSGCIGVAILKALPQATVDFVEIDTAHHPTILKNILQNDIDVTRAHILGGNLFEQVRGTYDYILTNPPYIDATHGRTEEAVIQHEPALALWGGTAGMEIIEQILSEAHVFLSENGILYIEHEPEQAEIICAHALPHGLGSENRTDQYGVLRFTRLFRLSP